MFIGGGKDQDDLMQRFMGLAGGAKAPVVIFPLASNDPAKSGQAYVDYLKSDTALEVIRAAGYSVE